MTTANPTTIIDRFLERVNFPDLTLYCSTNGHIGCYSTHEKTCKPWIIKGRPTLEDIWEISKDKDLIPADPKYPCLRNLLPYTNLNHSCQIPLDDDVLWGFLAASIRIHKNALTTISNMGLKAQAPDAWGHANKSLCLEYKIPLEITSDTPIVVKSAYLSKILESVKKSRYPHAVIEYDDPKTRLFMLAPGCTALYIIMPASFKG